jgi:hypothetical protein
MNQMPNRTKSAVTHTHRTWHHDLSSLISACAVQVGAPLYCCNLSAPILTHLLPEYCIASSMPYRVQQSRSVWAPEPNCVHVVPWGVSVKSLVEKGHTLVRQIRAWFVVAETSHYPLRAAIDTLEIVVARMKLQFLVQAFVCLEGIAGFHAISSRSLPASFVS